MVDGPTSSEVSDAAEKGGFNEQEMMEQLIMQMMIFGPMMEMMEEDREGEE